MRAENRQVDRTLLYLGYVSRLAESQLRALKWAESCDRVGIVSTMSPVGTFNRPFKKNGPKPQNAH